MRKLLLLALLAAVLCVPAYGGQALLKFNWDVANLPASCVPGITYWVTDGASPSDCTTGGGTDIVLCVCQTDAVTFSSYAVAGSGDITAVGSMTTGAAFADATADDDWIGLGASAGRIVYDDQSTDEIIVSSADFGVNVDDPISKVHIQIGSGSGVSISTVTDVAIDSSADAQLGMFGADAQDVLIRMGTPTDSTGAVISWDYDASPGELALEPGASGVTSLLRHDSTVALQVAADGDVLIGGDSNNYKLQFAETDSPGTCSATERAQTYYDISEGHLCTCDGTNWVDGVGTTCT